MSAAAAPGRSQASSITMPQFNAQAHGGTFVDPTRRGSAAKQVATGIMGIVLAITLVLGQISVATTHGIAANLNDVNVYMEDGNKTMLQIVEKSAPTVLMEKAVGEQSVTLASTRDSMVVLNTQMVALNSTVASLEETVGRMEATSGTLATDVGSMESDTGKIVESVGTLPEATTNTHTSVQQIYDDSAAINVELAAMTRKMRGYGLPPARGAE